MQAIDRELLELAAKAAGYDTRHPWNAERMLMNPQVVGLCITGVSTNWNPLDHDSDALRLAVKLRLSVDCTANDGPQVDDTHKGHRTNWGPDPYAATRRTIVRAAAEIGRGMK